VKHEDNKLITFERGEFYWIFNFHPTKSFPDYRVGVTHPGKYEIMLDTDAAEYGGHSRMQAGVSFFTEPKAWDDRPNSMLVRASPHVLDNKLFVRATHSQPSLTNRTNVVRTNNNTRRSMLPAERRWS
jgi:1,4-alpha-glucan branching enzyme